MGPNRDARSPSVVCANLTSPSAAAKLAGNSTVPLFGSSPMHGRWSRPAHVRGPGALALDRRCQDPLPSLAPYATAQVSLNFLGDAPRDRNSQHAWIGRADRERLFRAMLYMHISFNRRSCPLLMVRTAHRHPPVSEEHEPELQRVSPSESIFVLHAAPDIHSALFCADHVPLCSRLLHYGNEHVMDASIVAGAVGSVASGGGI